MPHPFEDSSTLSVAPFEHYMLADDSPNYPMTTHIRFWFEGLFDNNLFIDALKIVLKEQPLFQSFIAGPLKSRTAKLQWVRSTEIIMPWIDWQKGNEAFSYPEGRKTIDLYQEIGIRLFIRENDQKTELTIAFHHAVSDGKGIFNFLETLLATYQELKGGPKRVPLSNQILLEQRSFFGLSKFERLQRAWRDAIVLYKFFTMLPMTLFGKKRAVKTHQTDTLKVVRRTVPLDLLNKVKLSARHAGSTLNDLLLRDLFMTLGSWNHLAGVRPFGRRITIAVPVCMRGKTYQMMPASNFVSMHVLHVPNKILPDSTKLLLHIHKVMKFVKSFEMGHTLVVFAMIAGSLPSGLVNFFRLPLSRATAVLTNLGIPFQDSSLRTTDGRFGIPGLTLTGLETLPPIRDRTRIAISINSYDGDLRMTMRYDENYFDEDTAQMILDRYFDKIELTAEARQESKLQEKSTVKSAYPALQK
jgi:NRPS condensation-like uncharacterized protein